MVHEEQNYDMIILYIVWYWLHRHVSAAMDTHATTGELLEAVFSMWSMNHCAGKCQQKFISRSVTGLLVKAWKLWVNTES
jgi:hypothetical protein